MASGALPPAFPAVRIDGELYWDGVILSNTPPERIFDDQPRRNSLIFAVHLWHPAGPEPETIWQILNRKKDIQYSSRIASHIMRQLQTHKLRHVITELLEYVPEDPHVIEKVLNHKSGIISGVAAVYNRYGYEKEKRSALARWAQHVAELSADESECAAASNRVVS